MTYWENMDGHALSPVYSLAAHSHGLWLLSGLESGNIRLQSVRHDEGKEIALLKQHTSAVSVLRLTPDEKSLLSGSWDKKILDWDLNTGQPRRTFTANAGQISAIEIRPESSIPVPPDTLDISQPNGTYSSSHRAGIKGFANGIEEQDKSGAGSDAQAGSPHDSLFGADSLFGDADGGVADGGAPSGHAFNVDVDDEFTRALTNGIQQPEGNTQMDFEPALAANGAPDSTVFGTDSKPAVVEGDQGRHIDTLTHSDRTDTIPNGLSHAEQLDLAPLRHDTTQSLETEANAARDNVFLAASIDGAIRIWDRRQLEPVARISPRNVPPWCMNACWSPNGNYIYAGRRNGAVEEFSLHKGFRSAERVFKFPQGSGAVTALQAMPNGRHLVWYGSFCPLSGFLKVMASPSVLLTTSLAVHPTTSSASMI
jgi:transcriptional activator SPT8